MINNDVNYISSLQAAKKWNITPRRVVVLASSNKINGAIKVGHSWLIPSNASKPVDGRTKLSKSKSKNIYFRFPSFEGRDLNNINPALTQEEIILKLTAEAFHQCEFNKAENLIKTLKTDNIYYQIEALYFSAMIAIMLNKFDEFLNYYISLNKELHKDFPHQKEMESLIHEIDATLGINDYFTNKFNIDITYSYDDSYLSHLAMLTLVHLNYSNITKFNQEDLLPYEYIILSLDKEECLVNRQTIHFYLGLAYSKLSNKEKANFHFIKALEISQKYHLYYQAALFYYYYGKSLNDILNEIDEDFINLIHNLSDDIHNRYTSFIKNISLNSIYSLIPNQDFIYVFYALHGLTNKEIANLLHVSEKNIEKKYVKIYKSINVTNKKEMIDLYYKSPNKSLIINQDNDDGNI